MKTHQPDYSTTTPPLQVADNTSTSRRPLVSQTSAPPLMSVRQVAARLGVSYWTCLDLIQRGDLPKVEIPGHRRIKVDPKDLERLIENWKTR